MTNLAKIITHTCVRPRQSWRCPRWKSEEQKRTTSPTPVCLQMVEIIEDILANVWLLLLVLISISYDQGEYLFGTSVKSVAFEKRAAMQSDLHAASVGSSRLNVSTADPARMIARETMRTMPPIHVWRRSSQRWKPLHWRLMCSTGRESRSQARPCLTIQRSPSPRHYQSPPRLSNLPCPGCLIYLRFTGQTHGLMIAQKTSSQFNSRG